MQWLNYDRRDFTPSHCVAEVGGQVRIGGGPILQGQVHPETQAKGPILPTPVCDVLLGSKVTAALSQQIGRERMCRTGVCKEITLKCHL